MNKSSISVVICLLFILAVVTPMTFGIDFKLERVETEEQSSTGNSGLMDSDWPMYHHDLQLTGYTTSTAPDTNKVLWAHGTINNLWYTPQRSSPAIVDDTIYIGILQPLCAITSGDPSENDLLNNMFLRNPFDFEYTLDFRNFEAYLICMNASTGVEKWKTRLDQQGYIRGSPAVASGRVYITTTGSWSSPIGQLFCLNASDGSILWKFPLNGSEAFSPVVENGMVYASGWINDDKSSKICQLYCLDEETGIEIFNTSLGFGDPVDGVSIYNDCLYVSVWDDEAYETFLYCISKLNGTIYWNKKLVGNFRVSAPVIYDEKIFVLSNTFDFQDKFFCYIECFDAISGAPQWDKYFEDVANVWSTPAVANNHIYFAVSHHLIEGYSEYENGWMYCLDISTGDLIWNTLLTNNSVFVSSPAIADGKIYINSLSYVHLHGDLYCIDELTGDVLWTYFLLHSMYSSPAIADGRLYHATSFHFFTFDDAAPSNEPPILNVSGPKWGVPGFIDFTVFVEDPEGSDLHVVFEWSRDYPGFFEWERSSGESEVLSLPHDEEGGYWIRFRVKDDKHAWSEWEQVNFRIIDINLSPVFLLGSIENVDVEGNLSLISANRLFSLRLLPFDIRIFSSGEEIVISNDYRGFVGNRFIFGRFNADLN